MLYDLEVPDFYKVPLVDERPGARRRLGAAHADGRRPTTSSEALLPAPPVARADVPAERRARALRRGLRQRRGDTPHKVDITTTVTTDEGRVVFKNDEDAIRASSQGKRGGYGYTTRVAAGRSRPGRYVLTVEARSRLGDDVARAATCRSRIHASGATPMMIACCVLAALLQAAVPTLHVHRRRARSSHIDGARQVVARTAAEWATLWSQHAPDQPAPAVDFDSEMVVAVFLGAGRPPAIAWRSSAPRRERRAGRVVPRDAAARDAITAQVLTSPYHIVAIPKRDRRRRS